MEKLFLEDPKRIQAFANAQEAFKQAKEELDNKIFDGLREKLEEHGYKYANKEGGEGKEHWYITHFYRICEVEQDMYLGLGIAIITNTFLFFGLKLLNQSNNDIDVNLEIAEEERLLFNRLEQNIEKIFTDYDPHGGDWLLYQQGNKNIWGISSLKETLDCFVEEIRDFVQKLKSSEDFKNYEWLV